MLDQAAVADLATPPVRSGPFVGSLTIALAAWVTSVAVVAPTLLGSPAATRRTAVPVFVIGMVALFGLGVSDLRRPRDSRFARSVVAAGAVWSLSALALSSEPALYSVGRASNWLVDVALVYLLVSYPSGGLSGRLDRVLVVVAAGLVLLLYLPSVLVVRHFPSPGAWSLCTTSCPVNVFSVARSTPALVSDLVIPLREAVTVGMFLVVPMAVWRHRQNAGPLLRGMYLPVFAIAVFQVVTFGVFFVVRAADPSSAALPVVMWINVLSLPAVGLACVAGRTYRRLLAANALERLTQELGASASPFDVSRAVADALEDPSLQILHSFPGEETRWVDETGASVTLARAGAQAITEVESGGWRIAIVHDPALAEARSLVKTAGSYALAVLENRRLTSQLRSSIEALTESRADAVAAELRGRRKLERDLHDGAQQRLVALRIRLALAAERLGDDDPGRAEVINALGAEIDATIEEVRSFAQGVFPTALARAGLMEALREAGRSSALPTIVRADGLGRYPPELEATVYFVCSEALQNAAKHAHGATEVEIVLSAGRALRFEIRDDGDGFDVQDKSTGTGLSNLHDRLAAVAGSLTILSSPGQGTTIVGSIPLP